MNDDQQFTNEEVQAAKARAKAERDKPEHRVKPGSPADIGIGDADLEDPEKRKPKKP